MGCGAFHCINWGGAVQVHNNEETNRKVEEKRVASETGREEKLLNDETISAVKRLDRAPTNGRTSSMATSSVTMRETAISLNTPRFFFPSAFLSRPPAPPFPNYKAWCIYHWVNKNKKAPRLTQTRTNCRATSWVTYISQTAPLDYTGNSVYACDPVCRLTHREHRLNGACKANTTCVIYWPELSEW